MSNLKPFIDLGADNAENYTIPELVSYLQSTFLPDDFERVKQILLAKEERMKKEASAEVQRVKKELGSVEEKHGEMALSNLIMEDELQASKRECEVQRVRLVELQGRIKDLERGKISAEALVELYKCRFDDMGSRVSRLEEDAKVLMSELPVNLTRVNAGPNGLMDDKNEDTQGPHSSRLPRGTEAKEQAVPSDSDMKVGSPVRKKVDSEAVSPNSRKVSTMRSGGGYASVVEIIDSDDEPMKDNSPAFALKRKRPSPSESCDGDDSSSDSEDDVRNHSVTWENESDLLLALEKCPELCMRAVCALYREKCFQEKPVKGLKPPNIQNTDKSDALRGTMLAEFIIDGDPQATLKKSIPELQKHDPKGLEDCKRLATRYSHKLFEIYTKFRDPWSSFFSKTSEICPS